MDMTQEGGWVGTSCLFSAKNDGFAVMHYARRLRTSWNSEGYLSKPTLERRREVEQAPRDGLSQEDPMWQGLDD